MGDARIKRQPRNLRTGQLGCRTRREPTVSEEGDLGGGGGQEKVWRFRDPGVISGIGRGDGDTHWRPFSPSLALRRREERKDVASRHQQLKSGRDAGMFVDIVNQHLSSSHMPGAEYAPPPPHPAKLARSLC